MAGFCKTLKIFRAYLLTPFVGLLLILNVTLFAFPLWFYRKFVVICAKLFKKNEFGKMVTCLGNIMGCEDIYSLNAWTSFSSFEFPVPKINLDYIKELAMKNGVNRKNPDGSLQYPELTQEIKNWMGYIFWAKTDKKFDIDKHIVAAEDLKIKLPPITDRLSYQNAVLEMVRKKKWEKGRPIWDFVIFSNIPIEYMNPNQEILEAYPEYKNSTHGSLIVCRWHHALGDGFAFFKILSTIFGFPEAYKEAAKPQVSAFGLNASMFWEIWMMAKAPFNVANKFLKYGSREKAWPPKLESENIKNQVKGRTEDFELIGIGSDDFPMQRIKDIKQNLKVGFMAILLEMITAAVRNMILLHGTGIGGGRPLSSDTEMEISFPLPMPGHPNKMRNHLSIAAILLPIGISDPIQRLKKIQSRLTSINRTALPWSYFLAGKVFGSLPSGIIWALRKLVHNTEKTAPLLVTNLLGPAKPYCLLEGRSDMGPVPLVGLRIGSNVPVGGMPGYGFMFISYAGKGRLTVGATSKYFRNVSDSQQVLKFCLDELEMLGKLSDV